MNDQVATPPADAPAPPRFVNREDDGETVALKHPIEWNGKIYDKIFIRQITVGEAIQYTEKQRKDGAPIRRYPMFDAPDIILDALSMTDHSKVQEVVRRFLSETSPDE